MTQVGLNPAAAKPVQKEARCCEAIVYRNNAVRVQA